jgi:outer membrane protein
MAAMGGSHIRSVVRLLCCCAAAALPPVGATVPAAAQTLTEALGYAYQTNPQLLAQRASLRATDEGVPQALSNWRPTVNFTGQTGFQNEAISQTHVPNFYQNLRPSELDFNLTQPVYRGGRTAAATRQALETVEAARAQTLAIETTVFQAVAQGYLDTVRDQQLLEVNRDNEATLREMLEDTRKRYHLGEVTETDVLQAETSLGQAAAATAAAEQQLEISRTEYVRAVGRPPGRLLPPRERPALPATREEALRLAADANQAVVSANFTELAARDNVAVTRGQLLPTISIVGDFTRTYDESGIKSMWENTATLSAQMTMPLYEAGSVWSQVRQAEQTVGQRRSQVDDARRAAVEAAGQAWAALEGTRRQIARLEPAVRAALLAVQGTQTEALFGARTVLDVLIAQQQVVAAQSSLVTARHDAALAEFNLAAAAGRLVAADLNLHVPLYDMDRHLRQVRGAWIGTAGGLKE